MDPHNYILEFQFLKLIETKEDVEIDSSKISHLEDSNGRDFGKPILELKDKDELIVAL